MTKQAHIGRLKHGILASTAATMPSTEQSQRIDHRSPPLRTLYRMTGNIENGIGKGICRRLYRRGLASRQGAAE